MKASSEKSSSTTAAATNKTASQPFFAKAGGGNFFAPAATGAPSVQMKMAVNKPGDKFEQEADKMADKVMRMPAPTPVIGKEEKLQRQPKEKSPKKEEDKIQKAAMPEEKVQKKEDDKLQKAPATEEKLQRKGDGAPAIGTSTQSAIKSKTAGGGQPLSTDVRSYMEPRFNADFSNVRVHSDPESASLSNQLSARAFTHQNHVFFSRDQYQPGTSEGKQLLAHELTHTIQQGHAVQRSPQISATTTPPPLQRLDWGLPNPTNYIADKARLIPGFTMLTVVIGLNPITGASVDRSAGNILKGAIEMIPVVGAYITDALNNHGVFAKVSAWASTQFDTLKNIGSTIWQDIKDFIKNLSLKDLASPGDAWERGKAIITNPIAQIKAFASNLKDGIVTFIKDAILKPIAAFAKANVPNGYDLLCAVLGKDPISGEPVAQTAENLIGPFMKLIGQEEVWENMKKSGAIGRAWSWFQKALGAVKGFVQELPNLFMNAFKALDVMDIVLIPRAFVKLVGVFGGFASRFIDWAGTAVWNLLEIIFDAVSPGALGYIKKTGAAIKSIFKNPLPFLGNLIKAAKLGLNNFADNFGDHLKAGLIDWLTGSLTGVYIPKALSLPELGKCALSILGITWAQIRGKIVKVLGANGESIMKGLETTFDVVVALVQGGPAAAWELIKEKLTDLKDTVVSGIISFVTDTIVKKAIPKLIAMFIPGAGFISAIMTIYETVMVFVNKMAKIIQVALAFIDSIVTIAAGNIGAAAKRVESILGGLLSLAISFLAGFLGLGKVTDKIKEVIEKVRATVDKAIDAVIAWIVTKAKALFGKLFGGKEKKDDRTPEQKQAAKLAAINEAEKLTPDKDFDEKAVQAKLGAIKSKHKLLTLNLIVDSKDEKTETIHFTASASEVVTGNPKKVELDVLATVITPVPVGSWIKNLETKAYERVTNSASVVKKNQTTGKTEPVQFMTNKPEGGGSVVHAYAKEDKNPGWQRSDFKHSSKFVIPKGNSASFELIKAYRGSSYIRPNFYKDNKRASIKKNKLPGLKINKTEFLSEATATEEAACGYSKKQDGKAIIPVNDASADHRPPISQHWNQKKGNNTDQSSRETWNSDPNNYRIISGSLNSSLGGEDFVADVGTNFKGPGE